MTETPEGWIDLGTPSEATKRLERERMMGQDTGYHRGWAVADEDRACGFIGERGVKAWLRSLGVKFIENGGRDDRPDLVIARRGVGIRTRGVSATARPSYDVTVPVDQLHHGEERLFVVHERRRDRYLIVGGISILRVRARGTMLRKGDRRRWGVISSTQLCTRICDLEPPHVWLVAMMDRARATEAASATK